jgi:hypothetical protein
MRHQVVVRVSGDAVMTHQSVMVTRFSGAYEQ